MDLEISGRAKKVIIAVRMEGRKVDTWEDCLIPNLRTSLEDGKICLPKRKVTHAIHNAAKKRHGANREMDSPKVD